jgi:hypothetical protein
MTETGRPSFAADTATLACDAPAIAAREAAERALQESKAELEFANRQLEEAIGRAPCGHP